MHGPCGEEIGLSTYGFKSYRHARACAIICIASLAGRMAWGYYFFELPRVPVSWSQRPLATAGFFAWPVLGAYGVGYAGGNRQGLRYAAYTVAALICLAGWRVVRT